MARNEKTAVQTPSPNEWLGQVREVRHPLDIKHPIRVTVRLVDDGEKLPKPSVPFPERHP